MSDFAALFKLLSAGGQGGAVGSSAEPFNPAARLATGVPMSQPLAGAATPPGGMPKAPDGADMATRAGYAIAPNSMASMAGKGGASGG